MVFSGLAFREMRTISSARIRDFSAAAVASLSNAPSSGSSYSSSWSVQRITVVEQDEKVFSGNRLGSNISMIFSPK